MKLTELHYQNLVKTWNYTRTGRVPTKHVHSYTHVINLTPLYHHTKMFKQYGKPFWAALMKKAGYII